MRRQAPASRSPGGSTCPRTGPRTRRVASVRACPPGSFTRASWDLALGLIDQARGWQVPAGVVLGRPGGWRRLPSGGRRGGNAASFIACGCPGRRPPGRKNRALESLRFPSRGRPAHRRPPLSPEPENLLAIARALPASAWKRVTWRHGSKGAQRGRFATLSLWAANGWRPGPQPERVEEIALVQWPAEEPAPTRYWLARLERKLSLPKLVATARARWRVEQDYRELKDELGLDHFAGRSWQGFHHQVALVTTAFVCLRQEQARLHRRAQKKVCSHPRCRRCAARSKPCSSA